MSFFTNFISGIVLGILNEHTENLLKHLPLNPTPPRKLLPHLNQQRRGILD